ncbi:MAG: hypothetical protein OQL28_00625 [Sedimenticola sp.]|nr:hypothetical protein [Sedimenticola sp.]
MKTATAGAIDGDAAGGRLVIALIGAGGELGRRVQAQLLQHYQLLLIDQHNQAELEANLALLDMALILTPPVSHAGYLRRLTDAGVPRVLCEKPLPVIPDLHDPQRARVIDHYLFKTQVADCVDYYRLNAGRIKVISLSLCELRREKRPWMWTRAGHGGVILDLGHHLVSLLGLMAGDFQSLANVTDIALSDVEYFDHPGAAERALQLSFAWGGKQVILALGQRGEESKEVEMELQDGTRRRFDLSDRVDYRAVVAAGLAQDTSPLLEWDDAVEVSRLLNRMLERIDG